MYKARIHRNMCIMHVHAHTHRHMHMHNHVPVHVCVCDFITWNWNLPHENEICCKMNETFGLMAAATALQLRRQLLLLLLQLGLRPARALLMLGLSQPHATQFQLQHSAQTLTLAAPLLLSVVFKCKSKGNFVQLQREWNATADSALASLLSRTCCLRSRPWKRLRVAFV